jgi:cold shock CspA family protein
MTASFSRVAGTVKFFDVVKGFGFITPSDGSSDVFVHQTSIHADGFRSLAEGEQVEFTVEVDPKKGKSFASNVTGPAGKFVQGAPRQERKNSYDNDFGR